MQVALRTQPEHCWKWRYAPNRSIVGSGGTHTTSTLLELHYTHNQSIVGSGDAHTTRTLLEMALLTNTEHCWKWRCASYRNIVGKLRYAHNQNNDGSSVTHSTGILLEVGLWIIF